MIVKSDPAIDMSVRLDGSGWHRHCLRPHLPAFLLNANAMDLDWEKQVEANQKKRKIPEDAPQREAGGGGGESATAAAPGGAGGNGITVIAVGKEMGEERKTR